MELTFGSWIIVAATAGGVLYVLWILRGHRGDGDPGAVSQAWLTEHNSGKGDRFL
jgi:hypothetical protein